jgi:hypothetical protein
MATSLRLFGIFTAVFCLIAAAAAQDDRYTLRHQKIGIQLHSSGQINVQEQIEVLFNAPRRGIIRSIPVRYPTARGAKRYVSVSNIEVTDSIGRQLTTSISRGSSDLTIRIGDEDIYLPAQTEMTYLISYSMTGAIDWRQESGWENWAELYWNAIGHEWTTETESAEINIEFPGVPDDQTVRLRTFVGPFGSTGGLLLNRPGTDSSDSRGLEVELTRSTAKIIVSNALPPGDAVSFALAIPGDLVDKPSTFAVGYTMLKRHLGLLPPVLGGIFLFIAWLRKGRDPKVKAAEVAFEPPDGMAPSELGVLIDEKADPRDITAGIVNLAVKGWLTIHPVEEGEVFKKRTADLHIKADTSRAKELTKFETELYGKIKEGGSIITNTDLIRDVAPHVGELSDILYQGLIDDGYYAGSPKIVRGVWSGCSVGLMFPLCFLMTMVTREVEPWTIIAGIFLSVVIGVFFGYIMPKATLKGAEARSQAAGFAEFLRGRENYMEWIAEKKAPMAMFEEYLPYAVAFGLQEAWIRSFEGVLTEQPDWYHGHGTGFHMIAFSSDFNAVSNSLGSAAGTVPRSGGGSGGSGFSSGGSSGGGFGGGGGGSW